MKDKLFAKVKSILFAKIKNYRRQLIIDSVCLALYFVLLVLCICKSFGLPVLPSTPSVLSYMMLGGGIVFFARDIRYYKKLTQEEERSDA